jgi:hypothetical protein
LRSTGIRGNIIENSPATGEALMHRELKTVKDADGIPVLEIVVEGESVTIYEADDMDREIRFPITLLPILTKNLTGFKNGSGK